MEPPLQIFSQIFLHGLNTTQDRAADYALIHALVPSNLPIALAENEVGIHPAALDLRQGVEGVPEVAETIHALQQLLRGRLMHAGRVFDPVITVEGIVRLVVSCSISACKVLDAGSLEIPCALKYRAADSEMINSLSCCSR